MICSPRQYLFAVFAIAIALGAAGCTNNNSNTGTSTGPTPIVATETFSGSITQGATDIHNFTVANSGYNLLAGFTSIGPSTITALGVGIGSYDPTSATCGLNQIQNVGGIGATAITTTAPSGTFCVRVYDGGNVPAGTTATYTVQVQHY
jgi:hypothetical protein